VSAVRVVFTEEPADHNALLSFHVCREGHDVGFFHVEENPRCRPAFTLRSTASRSSPSSITAQSRNPGRLAHYCRVILIDRKNSRRRLPPFDRVLRVLTRSMFSTAAM